MVPLRDLPPVINIHSLWDEGSKFLTHHNTENTMPQATT